MSAPLEWAPLLKGRKLNERPGAHSDNYSNLSKTEDEFSQAMREAKKNAFE